MAANYGPGSSPGINLGGVGGLRAGRVGVPKPPRVNVPRTKGFGQLRSRLTPGPVRRSTPGRPATIMGTPSAATAPTPATSAAPTTPAPAPSPLDATYYANVAANQFKVNQAISADQTRIANLGTNLQSQLGALNYQQPRDALALEQRNNAAGALYSTPYAQAQGNLQHTYSTKESGLQTAEGQNVANLLAAIQGLQQGIPIFNANQALAAEGRTSRLDQLNPATGQVPVATPPAPAARAAAPARGRSALARRIAEAKQDKRGRR